MKKIIISLLFLGSFSFAKADMLIGFLDGAGLWNQEGVQLYTCFPDQTCVDRNNVISQKATLLGLTSSNKPLSPTQPTDTSFPIINPVTNQPLIAGGEPQATVSPISIIPDPSFTATSIPATGIQVNLGQWIVSNNTNIDSPQISGFLSFNYNGSIEQNEGFNNLYCGRNGGQNISQTVLGVNSVFTNSCGAIAANSSAIISIVGDSIFNSSSHISALTPSLQIYQNSGSALTGSASGTILSLIP